MSFLQTSFHHNKGHGDEFSVLDQDSDLNDYINQSISVINADENDSDLENSRVLKRSSLGLDRQRKSVIQMQSEKYILKKAKKMPVKHITSNINFNVPSNRSGPPSINPPMKSAVEYIPGSKQDASNSSNQ